MAKRQVLAVLFAASTIVISAGAVAQQYPAKPIRFIVPFAPGGGTDIVARLLALKVTETLKRPVVVDNRGGAGSTIGTELAAKSPPDGYTMVLNNIGLAFNASLYPQLGYDTLRDLAPVGLVATQPNLLVVHPSLPVKSTRDLIALARSRPGKIAFASGGGRGSGSHMAMELFKQMASVNLLHIPYKGTGPALTDLLGGQVQVMLSTFASAVPHVRNQRLRALGVTSLTRSTALPDVPTIAESGVPGFEFMTWYGVLVPSGTPGAIVQTLNRAMIGALAQADVKEKLAGQGLEPLTSSPEAFGDYLTKEIAKWRKVVQSADLAEKE